MIIQSTIYVKRTFIIDNSLGSRSWKELIVEIYTNTVICIAIENTKTSFKNIEK